LSNIKIFTKATAPVMAVMMLSQMVVLASRGTFPGMASFNQSPLANGKRKVIAAKMATSNNQID
jgi:hypothetical protein